MTKTGRNMYASPGIVQFDGISAYKIHKICMYQLCILSFGIIYYAQLNTPEFVYI